MVNDASFAACNVALEQYSQTIKKPFIIIIGGLAIIAVVLVWVWARAGEQQQHDDTLPTSINDFDWVMEEETIVRL
ncbi:hypothetical protein GYMLUDRAFT_250684 [Collybiopsis luxurians FD-317 M1]|uniref:Unplaced genomic scaffold GYMLUscaffold_85, whole genome shotgun sequence n=1 Tax=Collybiopsis luxurians FD-317 M1 TaxID=944289 RepID=A0A0D0CDS2_9AGAR|nr:hypothetical protein GYMLUDRAFT_250684 [Collybiopsis luxurians FD-317 M1]